MDATEVTKGLDVMAQCDAIKNNDNLLGWTQMQRPHSASRQRDATVTQEQREWKDRGNNNRGYHGGREGGREDSGGDVGDGMDVNGNGGGDNDAHLEMAG